MSLGCNFFILLVLNDCCDFINDQHSFFSDNVHQYTNGCVNDLHRTFTQAHCVCQGLRWCYLDYSWHLVYSYAWNHTRLCSAACCDGVFGNGEKSRGGKSSGLFHLVNIEGQMFAECPEWQHAVNYVWPCDVLERACSVLERRWTWRQYYSWRT